MNSIEKYNEIIDEHGTWENYLNSRKNNSYLSGSDEKKSKEMSEKEYNHTHLINHLDINPEMLTWARLNEGMNIEDAVDRFKEMNYPLSAEEILDFERGNKKVKLQDLQEFAVAYKRQLALFFFQKPPKQDRKYPVSLTVNYNNGETQTYNVE